MDNEEFYSLLNEMKKGEKEEKQIYANTVSCNCCHNEVDSSMVFCLFCGNRLREKADFVNHTMLSDALEKKNYAFIWKYILAGNLEAQDIFNTYIIREMYAARTKEKMNEIYHLIDVYRDKSLYAQGLWARATIRVNSSQGILDFCEIYRDSSQIEKALKEENEIAQKGDVLSLHDIAMYYLKGDTYWKKDTDKGYRYLYQAASKGYYKSRGILALHIAEKKCASNFLVGDIISDLQVSAFRGDKDAEKFLNNGMFFDSLDDWKTTETVDIWGKSFVKYIRGFQEYRDTFSDLKMEFPVMIAGRNSDNIELYLKFLEGKDKEEALKRIKEKQEEESRRRKERELEESLIKKAKDEFGDEYYFDIPEIYIGDYYYNGVGQIKKDYNKAIMYYHKAYEQGSPGAAYMIATMYRDGLGVKCDNSEMIKWYEKSSALDYAPAQFALGNCFFQGLGCNKDFAKALDYFRISANRGFGKSQCALGTLYYFADQYPESGLTKNYNMAVKWLTYASDRNIAYAQYLLGACYYLGQGVPKNLNESKKLLIKAADQDIEFAKNDLKKWFNFDHVPSYNLKRIEDACKNFLRTADKSHFEFTDGLLKKLKIQETDQIYLAYDNTSNHTGKEGFVIANSGLYYSSIVMNIPKHLSFTNMKAISTFRTAFWKTICADDKKLISVAYCSNGEVKGLVKLLNQIKEILKTVQAPEHKSEIEKRKRMEKELRSFSALKHIGSEKDRSTETVNDKIPIISRQQQVCPKCGRSLEAGGKFCQNCGFRLQTEQNDQKVVDIKEEAQIMKRVAYEQRTNSEAKRNESTQTSQKEDQKPKSGIEQQAKNDAEQKQQKGYEGIQIAADLKIEQETEKNALVEPEKRTKPETEKPKENVQKRKKNPTHLAALSLVCSIAGWVTFFMILISPILLFPSLLLGIVGIVFGVKSIKSDRKKMAVVGIIISALLLMLYIYIIL